MGNLITLLSIDSRSIEALLHERHTKHFDSSFPIFYRINTMNQKDEKDTRSAIDIALENKQYAGINKMIDHIVKYQNHHAYLYLFKSNMIELLRLGLKVNQLLESRIFCHRLDFDHWPMTLMASHKSSISQLETIKPYSESIFHLRGMDSVFEDEHDFSIVRKLQDFKRMTSRKNVFRVKYNLNLLPSIVGADDLMSVLGTTDNFELFDTQVVKGMIDYKWKSFAWKLPYLGLFMHIITVVVGITYVDSVYHLNFHSGRQRQREMIYVMIVSHAYLSLYELR